MSQWTIYNVQLTINDVWLTIQWLNDLAIKRLNNYQPITINDVWLTIQRLKKKGPIAAKMLWNGLYLLKSTYFFITRP